MRKGGGKQKGSAFERMICTRLSLWVSHGKRKDLFWRSAMSGGRSTVAHARGEHVRQAGDICSVSPEGHVFTDVWYIECKHYRDLRLTQFLLQTKGTLAQFWGETKRQARKHNRNPMLIAKQNNSPIIIITRPMAFTNFAGLERVRVFHPSRACEVFLLDTMLKTRF